MKSGFEGEVGVKRPLSLSLFTRCQMANDRIVEWCWGGASSCENNADQWLRLGCPAQADASKRRASVCDWDHWWENMSLSLGCTLVNDLSNCTHSRFYVVLDTWYFNFERAWLSYSADSSMKSSFNSILKWEVALQTYIADQFNRVSLILTVRARDTICGLVSQIWMSFTTPSRVRTDWDNR